MPLIEMPIVTAMTVPETDTSLVGCWLNPYGPTPWADLSRFGNNGTPTAVIAEEGNAGLFNGTSSTLNKPTPTGFPTGASPFTLSVWARPATVAATYQVLLFYGTNSNTQAAYISLETTGIKAKAYGETVATSATVAAVGQWFYIVMTYDGTNCVLYVNGTGTAPAPYTFNLVNGYVICGAYSGGQWFSGTLLNARCYSRALSADEIAYEWKRCVPDSTLVLAVDGRGRDLSRYRRTVTASGGPILGNKIELDGTDGMLDAGDVGNIQEVSMWVNPTTNGEQLFRADTNKSVSLVGGTVTYSGLTATATYVNGVAGTTVAAGYPQSVVCQFETVDANNLELGTDGAAYGQGTFDRWCVRATSRSAGAIAIAYAQERGECA